MHHRSQQLLPPGIIIPLRRIVSTTAFQTACSSSSSSRRGGYIVSSEHCSPFSFGVRSRGAGRFNTRLLNSMEDGTYLPSEEEEEEEVGGDPLKKWEKMFFAPMHSTDGNYDYNDTGFTTATSAATTSRTKTLKSAQQRSEIRVITFDLDNTIWKTSETISDANDALAAHLFKEFGIEERSEKRMGQLFRQYPERYAGMDHVPRIVENSRDSDRDEDTDEIVLLNVGQSEPPQVRSTRSDNNNEDDGVHITQPTLGVENDKKKMKPVYLTLLRKDAIRSLIVANDSCMTSLLPTTTSSSRIDLEQRIDLAFDVWMEARCQSISKNFVPGAVSTLQQLRSQLLVASETPSITTTPPSTTKTTTTPKKIYIGAITDGNSNPNQVPELSGLFDFVIRAEDVGVSKPDSRVYKAAVASLMVRLVQDGRSVEEFFLGETERDDGMLAPSATLMKSEPSSSVLLNWKDVDEDAVEAFSDGVGPWWVHVGDDFFKDVVAAKEFQMRSVWSRELIGGSGISTDRNDGRDDSFNGKSVAETGQRTVSDLVNDIAKSGDGILKLSIGPSEFLSQSIHSEFSDAILDRFGDLSDLLLRWQRENTISQLHKNNNIGEALVSEGETARDGSTNRMQVDDLRREYKFCISCGGKLPMAAIFCSSCGEKQYD